jgi:hypothetical protein
VSDEPLNSAQIDLANGIAKRVAAELRDDAAAAPLQMFKQHLISSVAKGAIADPTVRSLIAQAAAGHSGGPPIAEDESAVFTVPEFCAWARISRSNLYQAWANGTGPRFFKINASTRVSRRAAVEWVAEREAASAGAKPELEPA